MDRFQQRRRQRHKQNHGFVDNMLKELQKMSWAPGCRPMFDSVLLPTMGFVKDGIRFYKRCHKPDRREFKRTAIAVGAGILVMGAVGYLVKILQIPMILTAYTTDP
ncbi:protein transport protein Sec61 subunit gamma-1 [Drosophila guanche]|uniref:Blast:Probable protein transport protein Sec61 subunit gamma n=1 Tax=Drosophila guanche TaxID=7266 RepID=A0A3B0J1Y1_DROGU|nr:protein transport protein Sec61 subunit gamma-1 [Drosophila guanche]SPP72903.1 blast:Probable protein transport protein Sec61 subunit gamma [Drosophila guanche]